MNLMRRAHGLVAKAKQDGTLVTASACEACGVRGRPLDAAHEDYTRPLDVRWLCRPCHYAWDKAEPKEHDQWPYVRIILNVPPELARQIRELAERERRPVNTQIQVLVERALAQETAEAAA